MKLRFVVAPLLVMLAAACVDDFEEKSAAADVDDSAYVVFNYEISDRKAYDPYLAQVPATLEIYGAEVVVADFESDVIEGGAGGVTVVLKFSSEEAARDWYESPQYQEIIGLRTANSFGIASLASTAED